MNKRPSKPLVQYETIARFTINENTHHYLKDILRRYPQFKKATGFSLKEPVCKWHYRAAKQQIFITQDQLVFISFNEPPCQEFEEITTKLKAVYNEQ